MKCHQNTSEALIIAEILSLMFILYCYYLCLKNTHNFLYLLWTTSIGCCREWRQCYEYNQNEGLHWEWMVSTKPTSLKFCISTCGIRRGYFRRWDALIKCNRDGQPMAFQILSLTIGPADWSCWKSGWQHLKGHGFLIFALQHHW